MSSLFYVGGNVCVWSHEHVRVHYEIDSQISINYEYVNMFVWNWFQVENETSVLPFLIRVANIVFQKTLETLQSA